MKSLFDKHRQLTEDGIKISDSIGEVLNEWLKRNQGHDPIELEWIINSEVSMRMCEIYGTHVYNSVVNDPSNTSP